MPKLTYSYQVQVNQSSPKGKSVSPTKSDSIFLSVKIELPKGWSINSETPPDTFQLPTRLVAEAKNIQFGKPRFPPTEMIFSDAMGETLPLYQGIFEVRIPVENLDKIPSTGFPSTRITLNYQACHDAMCFPPQSAVVEH